MSGPGAVGAALDHLDLDEVVGLVVGPHRAIERRAVEEALVDVTQEIGHGSRRTSGIELDLNHAEVGFDQHPRKRRWLRGPGDRAEHDRQGEEQTR